MNFGPQQNPGVKSLMGTLLAATLLVILVANMYATVAVVRAGIYTKLQIVLQTVFVWVLPVLGAFVVVYVIRHDLSPNPGPENISEAARVQDTHNDNSLGM